MSLNLKLGATLTKAKASMPHAAVEQMERGVREIIAMNLKGSLAPIGTRAPNFVLPNHEGTLVSLAELMKAGPVVLVFYRGAWCPFCNLALRAYQSILPEIRSLGASLVAVSPEVPDRSEKMVTENGFEFHVLQDRGNRYARQYGIAFEIPEAHDELMRRFGLFADDINGEPGWALPDPCTFIIDSDGVIAWRFSPDGDYRIRAEPADVLQGLRSLGGE